LTVALSGFLAWVLAGVLMLGIYFIIYFPLEQQGSISLSAVTDFVAVLIRAGLTGGVVSTLGGICAVVSESIYMAWGLPFVGWYFCMILQERYVSGALWLYPPEWLKAEAQWGVNGLGLWLFLLLFLLSAMGILGGVLYEKLTSI
ncbi:MAG: ABC transporter permease, partial [Lachnospiraceae bacterium]|nr:ABC transporter permease [Lachnospiraceae bacterium]